MGSILMWQLPARNPTVRGKSLTHTQLVDTRNFIVDLTSIRWRRWVDHRAIAQAPKHHGGLEVRVPFGLRLRMLACVIKPPRRGSSATLTGLRYRPDTPRTYAALNVG